MTLYYRNNNNSSSTLYFTRNSATSHKGGYEWNQDSQAAALTFNKRQEKGVFKMCCIRHGDFKSISTKGVILTANLLGTKTSRNWKDKCQWGHMIFSDKIIMGPISSISDNCVY